MCNILHDIHEKIEPEGKAYKLVSSYIRKNDRETYYGGLCHINPSCGISHHTPTVNSHFISYDIDTDGWIRWKFGKGVIKHPPYHSISGFCLIPTLEGALYALYKWNKETGQDNTGGVWYYSIAVEVEYRQGLGKFLESGFLSCQKVEIMLAKEFKIIKEAKWV